MAFLTAVVGVVDSNFNNIAPLNTDGTRYPVLLKIGDNLVGTGSTSGGFAVVTLDVTGLGTGTAGDDEHGARGYQTTAAALLHPLATTTDPGFMSAADKVKVDSLGAWTKVFVDASAGPESHNASVGEFILCVVGGVGDDASINLPPISASIDTKEIRIHVTGALGEGVITADPPNNIVTTIGLASPSMNLAVNSTITLQAVRDVADVLGYGGSVWLIANGAPVGAIT